MSAFDRAWEIAKDSGPPLNVFNSKGGQESMPQEGWQDFRILSDKEGALAGNFPAMVSPCSPSNVHWAASALIPMMTACVASMTIAPISRTPIRLMKTRMASEMPVTTVPKSSIAVRMIPTRTGLVTPATVTSAYQTGTPKSVTASTTIATI